MTRSLPNESDRRLEDDETSPSERCSAGLAFLCGGRMCCGIVGADLMVRVAENEFDQIVRRRHVRPMDFTGRPLRGFVYVSPPGFRTATALGRWLSRGVRVAHRRAAEPAKSSSHLRKTPGSSMGGMSLRVSALRIARYSEFG